MQRRIPGPPIPAGPGLPGPGGQGGRAGDFANGYFSAPIHIFVTTLFLIMGATTSSISSTSSSSSIFLPHASTGLPSPRAVAVIIALRNEYELSIRASKHLECLLKALLMMGPGNPGRTNPLSATQPGAHHGAAQNAHFGGARGLNELLEELLKRYPTAVGTMFTDANIKAIRLIVGMRNKLIHDISYTQMDNRTKFVEAFKEADKCLRAARASFLINEQQQTAKTKKASSCAIM